MCSINLRKICNFGIYFRKGIGTDRMVEEVDNAIRKAVWEGRIACEIAVNPAVFEGLPQFDAFELHSLKLTPLHLFVHRGSYLPLLLPQIKVHFSRWLGRLSRPTEGDGEQQLDLSMPWFSWEGQPLHWHHPIGISFDICEQKSRKMAAGDSAAVVLPWRLQVNFHKPYPAFPSLIPFTDPDAAEPTSVTSAAAPALTIQQMFYSSWKQADCLRWGTVRRTANLSKAAQCQVWDGLWTRNHDRFWEVNTALVQEELAQANGGKQAAPMAQRVPVRAYILGADGSVNVKQWPIEMASSHTVQSILTQLHLPQAKAILHGLELHPETPLPWLALNCAYPDNFIHLLIALA